MPDSVEQDQLFYQVWEAGNGDADLAEDGVEISSSSRCTAAREVAAAAESGGDRPWKEKWE